MMQQQQWQGVEHDRMDNKDHTRIKKTGVEWLQIRIPRGAKHESHERDLEELKAQQEHNRISAQTIPPSWCSHG